jgi:hypothetical protein
MRRPQTLAPSAPARRPHAIDRAPDLVPWTHLTGMQRSAIVRIEDGTVVTFALAPARPDGANYTDRPRVAPPSARP